MDPPVEEGRTRPPARRGLASAGHARGEEGSTRVGVRMDLA